MKIASTSYFKHTHDDIRWFNDWVSYLEKINDRHYQRMAVTTSLGKTHIWGLNTDDELLDTLVIFPGSRTTSLFWDLDKGLDNLGVKLRIYLVETNGLPNLSEGNAPDIKSGDYGIWATEVLDALQIEKAFIAGASFGGLICMKLGIESPGRIKAAFLLNPGCLQPFSLTFKNVFYNLLPILVPTESSIGRFLDEAVFCKPNHTLSENSKKLIVEYERFALTRHTDNAPRLYYMDEQLTKVKVNTYLIEGDKDLLFPFEESIRNAQAKLSNLKGVKIFKNVGHGIETYSRALNYIGDIIRSHYNTRGRL